MTPATIANLADAPAQDRLAAAICLIADKVPDRTAIVVDAGSDTRRAIDYAALAAAVRKLEAELDTLRPMGVVARARNVDSLIVIAAACGRQHVPVAFLPEDARDLIGELAEWVPLDDSLVVPSGAAEGLPRGEFASVPAQVVVATSGTSGPPKLVEHSWDSLLAAARLAEQWHGLGWLLVYDATRWAGIQVWLQAVLTAGRLVQPASRNPDVVARAVADEHAPGDHIEDALGREAADGVVVVVGDEQLRGLDAHRLRELALAGIIKLFPLGTHN
jgi:acyl-coenzyme A synthetase/AMP-(fatty) acid ligase